MAAEFTTHSMAASDSRANGNSSRDGNGDTLDWGNGSQAMTGDYGQPDFGTSWLMPMDILSGIEEAGGATAWHPNGAGPFLFEHSVTALPARLQEGPLLQAPTNTCLIDPTGLHDDLYFEVAATNISSEHPHKQLADVEQEFSDLVNWGLLDNTVDSQPLVEGSLDIADTNQSETPPVTAITHSPQSAANATGTAALASGLPSNALQCNICNSGKRFRRAYELKRHMLKHQAIGDFPCPLRGCDRTGFEAFYRKDKLKAHLRQGHKLNDQEIAAVML